MPPFIKKPMAELVRTTSTPPTDPYRAISHRLVLAPAATLSARNWAISASEVLFSAILACSTSCLALSAARVACSASSSARSASDLALSSSAILWVEIAKSACSFSMVSAVVAVVAGHTPISFGSPQAAMQRTCGKQPCASSKVRDRNRQPLARLPSWMPRRKLEFGLLWLLLRVLKPRRGGTQLGGVCIPSHPIRPNVSHLTFSSLSRIDCRWRSMMRRWPLRSLSIDIAWCRGRPPKDSSSIICH